MCYDSWSKTDLWLVECVMNHPGVTSWVILESFFVILESSWIILDHPGSSWSHPGSSWVILDSSWIHPGSSWNHIGSYDWSVSLKLCFVWLLKEEFQKWHRQTHRHTNTQTYFIRDCWTATFAVKKSFKTKQIKSVFILIKITTRSKLNSWFQLF